MYSLCNHYGEVADYGPLACSYYLLPNLDDFILGTELSLTSPTETSQIQ